MAVLNDGPVELASELPLGSLFEMLPIGAYRSRPDGTLVRANPALARLNGFDDLPSLERAVHDIGREWYVCPQRRALFRDLLERDGQVRSFVSEVRRYADGARIWVSENAHLVRDAQGRVVCYEGTVEDITERMQAEVELARSEMFLREMAEHMPGMVYRVHLPLNDGVQPRYTFVSSGVQQLYGVTAAELLGDPLRLRPFRHPDDVAWVDAEVARCVAASAPIGVVYRIVVDGRVKWVQMSSSAVLTEGQHQVRVGVLLDVTAQRQSESLRLERDQAEAERQHMTRFLSRVSHELRTPLNAVLGFAQLIEQEPDTPPLQRRWTQSLIRGGRQLVDLVSDVLDVSGARSGELAMSATRVSLAPVVDEAWAMLEADALARGLRVQPVAVGGLAVHADARRLRQLLVNLLSNAIKYNRDGGELAVDAREDGDAVAIAVRDGGHGLTPEQIARLFRPFERLDAARGLVPGTGLGLTLSLQLARAMGGTLDVDSVPGTGSTFTLRLPRAAG